MPYSIRYRSRSKVQASELKQTYGQNFAQAFDGWLAELAEAASKQDTSYSVDGLELLRRLGNPDAVGQWRFSWSQLKNAS